MALDLSRIQALCFDLDGTLNNTDDQYAHNLASWLQPLKWLFPGKDVLSFARQVVLFTETPAQFFFGLPDRLGFDNKLTAIGDWVYQRSIARKGVEFSIIPGIPEMLLALHDRFPMSVVTARGQRTTLEFLERYSLSHHFICIATGQTCRHTKPFPDPVLWAASQMRVPAINCLMIGDTVVDIFAGKAAGAQTVGVLCGFGTEAELRRAGADLILPSTDCLLDFLQGNPFGGVKR